MSEGPIATAYVDIKPTPTSIKAFPRTVKTELDKALTKTTFKITLTPVLGTFKRKIQGELSTAKFTITVDPQLSAAGRQKLQKAVASAGLSVPVNLVPVGGIPGGVPGGTGMGGGGRRGRTTPKMVADQAAARFARDRLTIEKKLATALGETSSVEARKQALDELYAKTQAQITTLEIEGGAALETKNRSLAKVVNTETGLYTTLLKRVQIEKTAVDTTVAKKIADQEAAAAADLRTKVETERLALSGRLAAIDQIGLKYTGAVTIARQEAAAADAIAADAAKLYDLAVKTKNKTLIRETAALKESAVAEAIKRNAVLETVVAEQKASGATRARARREEQFARGGGATLLSRLGARGATLAAGGEFLAGAAIVTALAKSVSSAADLETELNVFRQTAQATGEEMDAVAQKAKELGRDITLPAVNANDAAQAMTELSKAGLSVEDSMAAARGTLQLATAAQLDNVTAVNITASALNAFGLEGVQATHVADLLAGAANEAQGGIGEMGGALSSVASVARQAGVSVEDTVALLTLLAKNGIQGAEAGTALRVAILRLIAPTNEAKKIFKELGIEVYNASGEMRPEVFSDIADAVENLGVKQRNQYLQTIYGTRAIRAQAVLGRENIAGLDAMREATNQAGLAADLAGARTEGFSGKMEAAKNSAATLGNQIGALMIPALEEGIDLFVVMTTSISEFIDVVGKASGELKNFAEWIEKTSPMQFIVEVIAETPGGKSLSAGFKSLKGEIEVAAGAALFTAGGASSSLGVGIPVAVLGAGLMAKGFRDMESAMKDIPETSEKVKEALKKIWEETPKTTQGVLRTAIKLRELAEELKKTGPEGKKFAQILRNAAYEIETQGKITAKLKAEVEIEINEAAIKESAEDARYKALSVFETVPPVIVQVPIELEIKPLTQAQVNAALQKTSGQVAKAMAYGGTGLAELQDRLKAIDRQIAKAKRKGADPYGPLLTGLYNERAGVVAQIKSINEGTTRAASEAISKADQDFLDALGFGRAKKENAFLRAQSSAGLADDIKTQTALRDYLVKKREEAAKTLRDAKTKAETVQSLTRDIIQANQTIADLNRQLADSIGAKFQVRIDTAAIVGTVSQIRRLYDAYLKELRAAYADIKNKGSQFARELRLTIAQTQRDAFAAINESFELDIQIAEASENKSAEIKARERFIAQLRKEQAQYRKGTLEWKRLQLEIINQQKAINDVRDAERDLFREMSFEFLTRQQGFAATVMGNLLGPNLVLGAVGGTSQPGTGTRSTPSSGTAAISNIGSGPAGGRGRFPEGAPRVGLPGQPVGKKPPSAFLGDVAGESAAGARGGTPSQFATIIHLLQQMVTLLSHQEARGKHPNNRASRGAGGAALDTM